MEKIIKFYPKNAADNPDSVLEQAVGVYDDVLVIGWDKEGTMDVRASTGLQIGEIFFLIDKFKHALFQGEFNAD